MDTVDRLNREFSAQDFAENLPDSSVLERYREVARNYARMENAVAVLSDLRVRVSYIYYGGFARMLGIGEAQKDDTIASIWEENLFRLVHPDDLAGKHLHELCFFHFVRQQPPGKRGDYYLQGRLRMKTVTNGYVPVLHRMFYIPISSSGTLWLALCLYSPLVFDMPAGAFIVHSVTGRTEELGERHGAMILSAREKQILSLIDKGLPSKEIADRLSISVHTVSRHRQEILNKLGTRNSIEACRVARELHLL